MWSSQPVNLNAPPYVSMGPGRGGSFNCVPCSYEEGAAHDQWWRCSLSALLPARTSPATSARGANAIPPAVAKGNRAACLTAVTELPRRGQRLSHLGAVAVVILAMQPQPLTPIAPRPMEGVNSGHVNHLNRTPKEERVGWNNVKHSRRPSTGSDGMIR